MTLDLDKLVVDLGEFSTIMGRLGIPCKVTFDVSGIPLQVREINPPPPVQVPNGAQTDHTIKKIVRSHDPVTPDKKAAATPSPAPKKKKEGYQTRPDMMIKCLWCERSMDRRSLHGHIRKSHTDLYKKDEVSRYIKGGAEIAIQGIDQDLLAAVPEVRPRTRGDPKELSPGDDFREGVHVRTTQMFEGILPGTIGTVRKKLGKNYEVNFGRPGYRTVPLDNLEAI